MFFLKKLFNFDIMQTTFRWGRDTLITPLVAWEYLDDWATTLWVTMRLMTLYVHANTHGDTHTHMAHAAHQPVNEDREGNESDGDEVWSSLHTVSHPVPLRPLSVCQVGWSTAAMTFDPGTEQQGKRLSMLGFFALTAKCPDSAGATPEGRRRRIGNLRVRWT